MKKSVTDSQSSSGKILFVNNQEELNGCVWYRNIIPAEYLTNHNWEWCKFPIPEDKFDYDIVMFNRYYQNPILPLAERVMETGAKMVFECDDLIDNVATSNPWNAFSSKDFIETFRWFIRHADLVTTTNEYLAQKMYEKGAKKVAVIPNAIRNFKIRPDNTSLRIGYTGSDTHYPELDFILDVLLDLQDKYDFEFHLQGMEESKKFEDLHRNFPDILKPYYSCREKIKKLKKFTQHRFAKVYEYQDELSKMDLDIGICYLKDTEFNRCKSGVKFYDYASVGTCTIASRVEAYKDCNYTVKNRYSDWKNKLEALIKDKPYRNKILVEQVKYVASERTIETVGKKWDEEFTSLVRTC